MEAGSCGCDAPILVVMVVGSPPLVAHVSCFNIDATTPYCCLPKLNQGFQMTLAILSLCRVVRLLCLGFMSATLTCATAFAQPDSVETSGRQLEAEVKAALKARQGQWVELATGRRSVRRFIAELERREADNSVLADFRYDYVGETEDGTGTAVERVWLLCDASKKRVIARRGYDFQGRPTYATTTPDAPVEPIERSYSGVEQLVCSAQYMLLEVPDGYKRLGELFLQRRAERASLVGARQIPMPAYQP